MRTDLVVLNFGGPRTPEEVEPFLCALFDDPEVIRLPVGPGLQRRFARLISRRRAPKIIPHYRSIGFSPLVPTSEAQVEALRRRLPGVKIHLGMRYTAPSIEDMVRGIAEDPPERLVALALFPHYSNTTTGSSFNALSAALEAAKLRLPIHYIPAFYAHAGYVAAMVDLIRAAGADDGTHLLFSAHGIPSSYSRDRGDPYPEQIRDSVRMIVRALGWKGPHGLSFQSRVGPVRWLEPATDAELIRLADSGVKRALVVPLSFTTEGIETLYEIDVELAAIARARGLELARAATVDTHPELIGALADLVERAIADTSHGGLGEHRCVRCLLPKPHAHRTRATCLDCHHDTPLYLLRLPPRT